MQVVEEILERTVEGMAAEGCPFRGVLFGGLMIKEGRAKLLEWNVRFGDPECQVKMQTSAVVPRRCVKARHLILGQLCRGVSGTPDSTNVETGVRSDEKCSCGHAGSDDAPGERSDGSARTSVRGAPQ